MRTGTENDLVHVALAMRQVSAAQILEGTS